MSVHKVTAEEQDYLPLEGGPRAFHSNRGDLVWEPASHAGDVYVTTLPLCSEDGLNSSKTKQTNRKTRFSSVHSL